MDKWYTRPVLFVTEIERAIKFYTDLLGFHQLWTHEEDERPIVTQVNRGECEIILALNAERVGKSRLFISLETDEMRAFQGEIAAKSIPTERTWWGYPVIEIKDPDGNELLFPLDEQEGKD
ncbi:VOC family protein [Chloroflexi bacterium TSY]|nr:VOC family protein [Chloroflexi bacterium TSY]